LPTGLANDGRGGGRVVRAKMTFVLSTNMVFLGVGGVHEQDLALQAGCGARMWHGSNQTPSLAMGWSVVASTAVSHNAIG